MLRNLIQGVRRGVSFFFDGSETDLPEKEDEFTLLEFQQRDTEREKRDRLFFFNFPSIHTG
jgi:hypothetical protein